MTKIREKWKRKRKKISDQEEEDKEEEKVGSRIRRRLSAN